MNINNPWHKSFIVFVILIVLLNPLTNSTQLSYAQTTTGDIRRDDILNIASRYASHGWNAAPNNIVHEVKTTGTWSWQVDTPDTSVAEGWWDLGANTSVPYQWGGWSALDDDDLNLIADYDGLYFNEQLEQGYAAGDIYTDNGKSGYGRAAGVDCSGLISRAWRTQRKLGTGIRNNTSGLYEVSRPIKFEDLRPGDILLTNGHVVLFEEFLTPEKATPNTTRIRVIEASLIDSRVSEREYTLTSLSNQNETWRGNSFETNQVTLTSDVSVYSGYWPRTYLNPIDIVLVIDRSGSMASQEKLVEAKNAAKMFVDQLRTKDKIGIVDFNTRATPTYQLTEIDANGTVKEAAKAAIDRLSAVGDTSLGAGLQVAQNQLNTRGLTDGVADPVKNIVLLSDGLENYSPYVRDVLPSIIQDKIIVYTVGLGSDADQELLSSIASDTNGQYKYAPSGVELTGIYNSILVRVYGGNVVRSGTGTVATGESVEQSVLVDSSIGTVTFSLSWPGSDLDLTLVQPDGTLIDPAVAAASENIEFVSGPTYEFYQVDAPQYGEWRLRIFGVSTSFPREQYSYSISTLDSMTFSVASDRTEYKPNDPINIVASIEDTFLDVPTPQYILGAEMEVVVQDPLLNTYFINLYDDGQHGDGGINDGIYGNRFTNTSMEGSYNFNVIVIGNNNRDASPFSREESLSIVVKEPPDQYEPDNIYSQASTISLNSMQTHSIIPVADVDWMKFTLNTTAAIRLETFGDSNSDTEMWLYDEALRQKEYDNNDGIGSYSFIDRVCGADALPAGTYYVKVGEYGNNSEIHSYNLAFTVTRICFPGADTTGVFRPGNGVIFLKNSNTSGFADVALNYGLGGDYPVTGDWDGDGIDTIGVYRNGRFLLRNSNTVGFAEINFTFGQAGDQPIAGDWNNDGIDTIGVYRPSTGQFLLRNSNSAGAPDRSFFLGLPGDVGIAGDWNGDGIDTTGVFRPSSGVIFLKNNNFTGFADVALNYGLPGDKPVVGDWDDNGIDTIGVFRRGTFLLRNSNTNGFANIVFDLGFPTDMPIAGKWDGVP